MSVKIKCFAGEYAFLSNFYRCDVTYEGRIYPSVEHAYQAAKTLDDSARDKIARAPTPGAAKYLGRFVELRCNWSAVRLLVMRDLLREKFACPELADKLTATGACELIEGNYWGDAFWGKTDLGNGPGENWLGRLLMQVRSEKRVNAICRRCGADKRGMG
jgi:ribA/ribD-fused uncharacterized protein